MARSYATVGQMLTFAMDRSLQSTGLEGWASHPDRSGVILRHMLEFVLMAPRSRSAFLRTVARTAHTTGSIVAAPRLRRNAPDLVAEMFPATAAEEDGARLGIALRTGGAFDVPRLQSLRAALGISPHHLLIAISRRVDLRDVEGELPAGVICLSWDRLSRRMAEADPGHAALWETIGEIGENSGRPVVQFPVDAKKLLTRRAVAREFRAHLDVLHQAGRTLLGSSAHFSTRRGQATAHLQVGVGLHRTGLEFGEVKHGTPVHLLRTGQEPTPLGIGRLEDPTARAAARERLDALARRRSWRTGARLPQVPTELVGTPASPEVEGARLLLWGIFNPMLLRDRGFDLAAARRQPALTASTLGLRLHHRGDDSRTTYRIWVGGEREWRQLIPNVTREASDVRGEETYAIAPRKNQSTADFVWEVHRALRSLTIT